MFIDEPYFDTVTNNFETKFAEISKHTKKGKGVGKGKAKNKEFRKGSGKGAYAALDFFFDAKQPFWCKCIQVHNWRNNVHVKQVLKDEETAQGQMETSEG